MSLWCGWYGDPTGDPIFDGDRLGSAGNSNGSSNDDMAGCVLFIYIGAVFLAVSILMAFFYPKGLWILLAVAVAAISVLSVISYLKRKSTVPEERKAEPVPSKVCPECGRPMAVRTGRFGRFWGCTGYPSCRHTERYIPEPEPAMPEKENEGPVEKPVMKAVSYLNRYDQAEKERIMSRLMENEGQPTLADLNRAIASLHEEGRLPSGVCDPGEVEHAYQRALRVQGLKDQR